MWLLFLSKKILEPFKISGYWLKATSINFTCSNAVVRKVNINVGELVYRQRERTTLNRSEARAFFRSYFGKGPEDNSARSRLCISCHSIKRSKSCRRNNQYGLIFFLVTGSSGLFHAARNFVRVKILTIIYLLFFNTVTSSSSSSP